MPTNEERRKAAQKLRNSDIERHQLNPMVSHATVTICGSSIVCIDEESLRMALDYLADLIEPEPERTCKWVWHEEWEDTPGGRECVCANWELDCGCWDWSDEELSSFDNIESKPNNGWKVCPRCGAKVVEQRELNIQSDISEC